MSDVLESILRRKAREVARRARRWEPSEARAESRGAPDALEGADGDWVYFVHSYHAAPSADGDRLATVAYGGDVPAVTGRDNVVGVQFHPEKSARAGLAMLRRFADWIPASDG